MMILWICSLILIVSIKQKDVFSAIWGVENLAELRSSAIYKRAFHWVWNDKESLTFENIFPLIYVPESYDRKVLAVILGLFFI